VGDLINISFLEDYFCHVFFHLIIDSIIEDHPLFVHCIYCIIIWLRSNFW